MCERAGFRCVIFLRLSHICLFLIWEILLIDAEIFLSFLNDRRCCIKLEIYSHEPREMTCRSHCWPAWGPAFLASALVYNLGVPVCNCKSSAGGVSGIMEARRLLGLGIWLAYPKAGKLQVQQETVSQENKVESGGAGCPVISMGFCACIHLHRHAHITHIYTIHTHVYV